MLRGLALFGGQTQVSAQGVAQGLQAPRFIAHGSEFLLEHDAVQAWNPVRKRLLHVVQVKEQGVLKARVKHLLVPGDDISGIFKRHVHDHAEARKEIAFGGFYGEIMLGLFDAQEQDLTR